MHVKKRLLRNKALIVPQMFVGWHLTPLVKVRLSLWNLHLLLHTEKVNKNSYKQALRCSIELGYIQCDSFRKNRRWNDHISELRSKYCETDRYRNRNLHLSKILILFSGFVHQLHHLLHSQRWLTLFGFSWWFVEKRGNRNRETAKIGICTSLKSVIYFHFISDTISVQPTTFANRT